MQPVTVRLFPLRRAPSGLLCKQSLYCTHPPTAPRATPIAFVPEAATSAMSFFVTCAMKPTIEKITKPANMLVHELMQHTITESLGERKWEMGPLSRVVRRTFKCQSKRRTRRRKKDNAHKETQRSKTETRQHWLLDNIDIWEVHICIYASRGRH